ncbi:chaperonin CsaA [Jejuia pallidilutea]|uniref:Chaperonin CsaA n=1 Tax=Jejuia pallidilutea TaxID=504487 RepID=A0A090VPH9_9FLAO|nr:chaperonin CsaA [Jejuia pallidilutea]
MGTIIAVNDFPEAKKPAYQLTIDFGDLGVKKSSAQITTLYSKKELINKQIIAVINFPKKQIAKFMSGCLVLGAVNAKDVILLKPETKVRNGSTVT